MFKEAMIYALRRKQVRQFLARAGDCRTQLDRFNAVWQDACAHVPFYADWKSRHGLPDTISGLGELRDWPILEKADIIRNPDLFVRTDRKPDHASVTGGATGEPLHFFTMRDENAAATVNKWTGWARMGLWPDSRCFLLWGHRHFYGQGWRSNVRFKIRQIQDWLTNNMRADATDLSSEALRADVRRLIRFRPEGIIAYSASLLALVRTCRESAEDCRRLGVRAVICTAGPLTAAERQEIGDFFGAPVGMEYGSMEAGTMAYQTPATDGRYVPFDASHLLHVAPEPVTGNSQVLVTKLTPCYLPLVRYRIGDCICGERLDEDGIVRGFDEVFGRVGDLVDMGNGIRFHGYGFMTCAEGFDKIVAYQIRVNRARGNVTFVAQATASLTAEEKAEIVKRAAHMSGLAPESVAVEESQTLVKAPSGKIRLVIEENG